VWPDFGASHRQTRSTRFLFSVQAAATQPTPGLAGISRGNFICVGSQDRSTFGALGNQQLKKMLTKRLASAL
jgi:hypothetical protein